MSSKIEETLSHLQIKKKPILSAFLRRSFVFKTGRDDFLGYKLDKKESPNLFKCQKSETIQRKKCSSNFAINEKKRKSKEPLKKTKNRRTTEKKKPKFDWRMFNKNMIKQLKNKRKKPSHDKQIWTNKMELYLSLREMMNRKKREMVSTLQISNNQNSIWKNRKIRMDKWKNKSIQLRKEGQTRRKRAKLGGRAGSVNESLLMDTLIVKSKEIKSKCDSIKLKKLRHLKQKKGSREKVEIRRIDLTAKFERKSRKMLNKSARVRPKKKTSLRFQTKFHDSIKCKNGGKPGERNKLRPFSQRKTAAGPIFSRIMREVTLQKLNSISESRIQLENFLLHSSSLRNKKIKAEKRVFLVTKSRPKENVWDEEHFHQIQKSDPRISANGFGGGEGPQNNFLTNWNTGKM